MDRLNDYPAPLISDWGKSNFPNFKSDLNKQNKLLINTTSTHAFWLPVFNEILDDIESKVSNI